MFQRKILLASKSPRRSFLLKQAGIPFELIDINVEETYPDSMPVHDIAPYLAKKKAAAAKSFIKDQEIVLTADSVVILGDAIYEKPVDKADAQRILRNLSGQIHEVVTGVCLMAVEKEMVFSGVSKVYFEELSDSEIDYYIDQYQPFDKAGAYAIQEWIGLCKVSKIEGTYSNIMGLPVDLVYKNLQTFQ